MKVSDLTRVEIDTHVAIILGWSFMSGTAPVSTPYCGHHFWFNDPDDHSWRCTICRNAPRRYSSEWQYGGPVIELLRIGIVAADPHPLATHNLLPQWRGIATEDGRTYHSTARLPLRAAMQVLVLSRNPKQFEIG